MYSSSEVELHSSTYSTRWINLGYIFFGILLGLEPGMFPVHTAMLPSEPFWLRLRFTIGKVQNQLFRVKKTFVNSLSAKIQDLRKLGLDYLFVTDLQIFQKNSVIVYQKPLPTYTGNCNLRTREIATQVEDPFFYNYSTTYYSSLIYFWSVLYYTHIIKGTGSTDLRCLGLVLQCKLELIIWNTEAFIQFNYVLYVNGS